MKAKTNGYKITTREKRKNSFTFLLFAKTVIPRLLFNFFVVGFFTLFFFSSVSLNKAARKKHILVC